MFYTDGGDGKPYIAGSVNEGVIQLEFNGRLGHICGRNWHSEEVKVACKQLGLGNTNLQYRNTFDTFPEEK